MIRVLRELARSPQVVSAYFDDGREFIITSLLGIDSEHNKMLLDYGPDDELNRRLIAAGEAVLVANPDNVRVQFKAEDIRRFDYQGEPAFVATMPASIIRIQRREFHRLSIPIGSRLVCRFMADGGTAVEATVVDISVGGIGLIESLDDSLYKWEPGTVIPAVRIELPGEGGISVDMEIRSRFSVNEPGHGDRFRIGCMFLGLANRQSAAIQRYIHRMELERRRLLHG